MTIFGKKVVSSAAKIQCVKLPSDWPFARNWSGKISEISTQITAPWPMACAAMKAKMHAGTMAKCSAEERPRAQPQRGDVAERADIQQRAPAEPVNEPQADEREDEIRDADADRLQQCRLLAEPGEFEDARREVEDGIDAGELIEEGDEERDERSGRRIPLAPEAMRRSRRPRPQWSSPRRAASISAADACGSIKLQHSRAPPARSPLRESSQRGLSGMRKHASV